MGQPVGEKHPPSSNFDAPSLESADVVQGAGGIMYAVIQTGGKQYRVSPGDVVKVESLTAGEDGSVEFGDVLAFSGESGSLVKPKSGKVLGTVVQQGRGDKILVFHFKRKKQYKKLQGHRQGYTQVRISEIHVDGNRYTA
jgi:large subunit ribosomal protein L21